MTWSKIKFNNLYSEPSRNGVYKSTEFHGSGVKVVNMGELFAYDRIGPQAMNRIELSAKEMDSFLLKENDLLFARRSLVESGAGKAAIVQHLTENTTFESSVIRVRLDGNRCNPLFYLYWFRSPNGRAAIQPLITGINVKGIRGSELSQTEVDYPSVEVQNRIVSILSAYDDLIENNQKQIKLLEEAAQRLYKEWFIDLRFPSHESTPIVNGLPEGWRKGALGNLCYLKTETVSVNQITKDTPYIGLEHMPRADFCLASWGIAGDVSSNKLRYNEDDIIFGKIRPYFHKVGFALNNGVVSTDSFVLKAKEGFWGILLMTVFDKAFVDYTYKTCKEGAKMPRADWKQMEKYKVIIPNDTTRQAFEDIIWTITRKLKSIAFQNRIVLDARDRLLPKLMNGELEV